MYQFESRIRYSEVGPDQHLTLPSIINYFQDCSTFQAEDFNIGLEHLNAQNLAWILNSWQIVVERFPRFTEKITVGTWAYDFKGIYGKRNYIIKDAGGEPCAYANSIWVLMNMKTHKLLRIPSDFAKTYGMEEKYPMDYASRKITLPDSFETREPFFVVPSNLDTNLHVNNGQYIQMAEAYLPKDFVIHQMRAEYRNSALLGDQIIPKIHYSEHTIVVLLCHVDGSIYAIVEFTGKD